MVSTAGLFIDSRVAFSLNRRRENGLKINSGHSLFLAAPAELCWETTGARWLGFFLTEDSLRKAPASLRLRGPGANRPIFGHPCTEMPHALRSDSKKQPLHATGPRGRRRRQ